MASTSCCSAVLYGLIPISSRAFSAPYSRINRAGRDLVNSELGAHGVSILESAGGVH